jgi:hypothetical protein
LGGASGVLKAFSVFCSDLAASFAAFRASACFSDSDFQAVGRGMSLALLKLGAVVWWCDLNRKNSVRHARDSTRAFLKVSMAAGAAVEAARGSWREKLGCCRGRQTEGTNATQNRLWRDSRRSRAPLPWVQLCTRSGGLRGCRWEISSPAFALSLD